MNKQHLHINSEESLEVSHKHPFNSRNIIVATCLFFASMSVAMADACSSKQIEEGCKDKTSSTGYKWCDCPAKSFTKNKGSLIDREGSEPGGSLGNNRAPNARVEGAGFK